MSEKREYVLIKFGASEAKRKDIKSVYIKYAFWLKENNGKILTIEEIFNDWKELSIYVGDKKKKMEISREVYLIKKLGLGKFKKRDSGFLIEASEVSLNIENDEGKLWGMEKIDFFFFQIILKQKYLSKNKECNTFKDIFNFLENNNFELNENVLINKEYEEYIKKLIIDKDQEGLSKLLRYQSGPSKENENYDSENTKGKIIDFFIKLQIEKDESFSTSIKNLLLNNKLVELPKGLSFLLFGEGITLKSWFKNIENFPIKILDNDEEFFKRIKSRIIKCCKNEYLYLIRSHFNSLRILFEFNNDNILEIDYLQKEEIKKILDSNKLNELIIDKYYSPFEFIKIFNLNNNISFLKEDSSNIFEKFYKKENLINLLNEIKGFYKDGKEDSKKFNELLEKHPHINGLCDKNTFFEFISGLVFLSKCKKTENLDIKKYLNLKVDSQYVPQRFAGPGIADGTIILEKELINIEPTTQIFRQTKMELDSARGHLINSMNENKEISKGICIIIAPLITKLLSLDIKGWNEEYKEKMTIKLFDIDSLIEMLKSEKELSEFIENHSLNRERLIN
ncbi:MAG: hypothetical protein ACRDA7_01335 [Metamycoplasmataceae bacterium]